MERVNWQRVRDILIVVICIGILGWAAFSIMGIFVHTIVLLEKREKEVGFSTLTTVQLHAYYKQNNILPRAICPFSFLSCGSFFATFLHAKN